MADARAAADAYGASSSRRCWGSLCSWRRGSIVTASPSPPSWPCPDRPTRGPTDRTSEPAEVGRDLALPAARRRTRHRDGPSHHLGARHQLAGASRWRIPDGPGPVFVTTLDGRVHAVDLDASTSKVVLDISDRISTGGERGLLGIAIDADGERMYLDFTDTGGDTEIRSWPLGADGLPKTERVCSTSRSGNRSRTTTVATSCSARTARCGSAPVTAAGRATVARWPRTTGRCSARCCGSSRIRTAECWLPVEPRLGAAGDLGHRAAQPVAVQLRPGHRPAVDRRRGPEHDRGGDVVDGDAERPNFGWDTVEGANDYEGEPRPSSRCRGHLRPRRWLLDHRRLRVPRRGHLRPVRLVPLRRLLHGFIAAVPADDPTRHP